MKLDKLIIAVTFYYVEERLKYLSAISQEFANLAHEIEVFIITNTKDEAHHEKIIASLDARLQAKIFVPQLLGHPYLLTWCHFSIFREQFEQDESISHFMYLEDDILIRPNNIAYWLQAREDLRPYGLIPSFLRFELKAGDTEPYSSDVTRKAPFKQLPKVKISDNYYYINLPKPYQGMYLMDRDLMKEHLFGPSSNPDFGIWNIREKAAQGLTFANVPEGYFSRNLVGDDNSIKQIDSNALIHHTPNNYANNPDTGFGDLAVSDLVDRSLSGCLQSLLKPKKPRKLHF
jgi:hypothetical protein